jgi:WD40 repeat protein
MSTNWGMNWERAAQLGWLYSIATSADGRKLVTTQNDHFPYPPGVIHMSTNSGVTWTTTAAISNAVTALGSSADGNRLVAVTYDGGIYTWQTTPTPVLSITPSGSNFVLSWIIPSAPFVLQQTADLATPDWTDVPTPPILNLTNLQNQLAVPLSSSKRFFRLKGL